jgi:hypothetical protein
LDRLQNGRTTCQRTPRQSSDDKICRFVSCDDLRSIERKILSLKIHFRVRLRFDPFLWNNNVMSMLWCSIVFPLMNLSTVDPFSS